MKNITVMMKPASSLCNMACKYCFYADVSENREDKSFGLMSDDVMRACIDKTLAFAAGGGVNYAFQGGEPLIAGLDFFKRFVSYVKEKNDNNAFVTYALQTNGTLLSDEFCSFFHEHRFLIGISLDGKADLHNSNRVFRDGKGTFNKVMQGVDLLKKHKVDFNVLTVTTKQSARSAKSLYTFLTSHGFDYMQFITCLEPFCVEPFSTTFAMDNDDYFVLNKTLFDLYVDDLKAGKRVSIRYFDNLIGMLQGKMPELCGMSGVCSGQLIIEGNGNCYPCDFYCVDEYLLGNILTSTLEEFAASENMRKFTESSRAPSDKCRSCDVYPLCRGGCRRERDVYLENSPTLNIYCEGRKKFFRHVIERLSKER